MQDSTSTLIQKNPRPKLQGRSLSNWSVPDVLILITILATAGLAFWKLGPVVGVMPTVFLVTLFRSPTGYGRVYVDVSTEMASTWRNDFHQGIWWRKDDNEGSKLALWLRKRHDALPAQFVRIQTEIDGAVKKICLLHQTDRPYDHFYITARGGAFASADVNQQTRYVAEMNDLLNQIIAQSGLKAGISQLRITGPFNQMIVSDKLSQGIDPVVAKPELFNLDEPTSQWVEWARENARQIPLALEQHRASHVWSLIVVTIKRRRKWKSLKFTNQQISEIPIIELGQALIDGLREKENLMLEDVHSPDLPESALIARCSWDVVGIGDYYRRRSEGAIPKTDEEIDAILDEYEAIAEEEAASVRNRWKRKAILAQGAIDGAREVDRRLEAWPQVCIETLQKENYLKFDNNYIAVLRVTELPKEFRSDQIMSMHWLVKNRWTRFAFVAESTSGEAQSNMLVYKASLLNNYDRAFYANRIVRDPRRSKKSREIMDQLDQMSVNTIAQMANGLITVIERDPERLRRAVKEVKAKYGSIGFKTEQVIGSARLIDYFFSGALAANRA